MWNKQEKSEAFNTRKSNPSDGSFLHLVAIDPVTGLNVTFYFYSKMDQSLR